MNDYRTFDEVTADCLQIDDMIQIDDAATSETVYVLLDDISDLTDSIEILAHEVDDLTNTYEISFDPDDVVTLYLIE